MLTRLLEQLASASGPLSLAEISRALNAQPSAVQDMIDLLVRKGKLRAIGPDGLCCTTCGKQTDCQLLVTLGRRYVAAERVAGIPETGAAGENYS